MAALGVAAQQLPNVGFEGNWVDCYPWTSLTETMALKDGNSFGVEIFGLQPEHWTISNVLGALGEAEGGGYGALGTTEVGKRIAGNGSETAVALTNNPNPIMPTQIVPAYITLGKTWATNAMDFSTFSIVNKDGGTFGGLAFDKRPDALVFDYMLTPGETGLQKATVLVYAWKGSWSQAEVPGHNSMSSEVATATMADRDRNILGMETAQGGAVTHSDNAELIAKSLKYIESEASAWTTYTLPIDYLTASTPEKINVVLAANDYFDSENIVKGNTLSLDNVKFAYYSRLEGVNVKGAGVEGFNPDKYEYTVAGAAPAAADIEAVVLGSGKSAKTDVKVDGNNVTITVSNENGEDVDGKTSHVYTLTFSGAEAGQTYNGYLNIEMFGGKLTEDQPTAIVITPTGDNKCTFVLPDLSLDLGNGPASLGKIEVPDVTITENNGVKTYAGKVDGMKLMGGAIEADVVLNGTIDAADKVSMKIDVMWLGNPINVTFTTDKMAGVSDITVDDNAEAEYYRLDGVKVSEPTNGIYIRRQGNKVTKVIVK